MKAIGMFAGIILLGINIWCFEFLPANIYPKIFEIWFAFYSAIGWIVSVYLIYSGVVAIRDANCVTDDGGQK